ncbi:glycosyltransferase [Microbacterium trichothecenolyticum]|uniref:Glycosyl transferases group 1 n=1 Tax=Microbacterium trichothecenolyticum TaxID=69370 RepID=A0A0M2H3K0_MICTR|nr:glycosyltransferase [Microbacterium trichothecenolyticum]KJL40818.1 hypothetical protein RS82_03434 [Microbacterium trichothecenolyticum]
MIAQSVWLWDRWPSLGRFRRGLYRSLLQGPSLHTTLSRENAEIARAQLQPAPVALIPFGTQDISSPNPHSGGSGVVAPGNDRHRDWQTLMTAVSMPAPIPTQILTRRLKQSDTQNAPSVNIQQSRSTAEMAAAYARAGVVVVPLHSNHHASGITVGLEAMSLSKPLVIADIGGVRDYFEGYAEFYAAGDASSLRTAVGRAAEGVAADAPSKASRGLTADDYVHRHLAATAWLLRTEGSLADIERFAPFRYAGVTS